MKRNKNITPQQLFGEFNALYKLIVRQLPAKPGERDAIIFGMHLGHEPPGMLTMIRLRGCAASAYEELQATLLAATHWGRRGSRERLKKVLNCFLLEMATTHEGSQRGQIKQKCIAQLEDELGGAIRRWRIFAWAPARLVGAHEDVWLNGIRFRCLSGAQRESLDLQIQKSLGREKRHAKAMLNEFSQLSGRDVVCEVDVEARDEAHAFIVAQELITDRLELYAGIAALLRDPSDSQNDPRRRSGPGIAIEIGVGSGKGSGQGSASDEVDLTRLVEVANDPVVRKLLRLVEKKIPTDGERRLISALRWSGRSRRADTETSSFLYAVIAYETILNGESRLGIRYSLGLRCAHLVGKTQKARRAVVESVQDSYSRRSGIVHAGTNHIELDELVGLWKLLNRVIFAYMSRGFDRRTDLEIEQWFEGRLL